MQSMFAKRWMGWVAAEMVLLGASVLAVAMQPRDTKFTGATWSDGARDAPANLDVTDAYSMLFRPGGHAAIEVEALRPRAAR